MEKLKRRIKERRDIMPKNISEKDVYQALGRVMHPEIIYILAELGMVKDVALKGDEVTHTLLLPFLGIPASTKDYLANSLHQGVTKLGIKVEVRIAEMAQEKRLAFLAMEQEGWKGL